MFLTFLGGSWGGALALTWTIAVRLGVGRYVSAERFRQVIGWTAVGVASMVVEIALLGLLYQTLGLPLTVASAIAAEALILARFLAQDRWVFGYATPTRGRLLRYHGAAAGSFVVSWIVLNGSSALLGADYRLAWLLGTLASFVWSFLASFFWVWRTGQEPPSVMEAVILPELLMAARVEGMDLYETTER